MNELIIEGKVTAILNGRDGVGKDGKKWYTKSFVLEVINQRYPKHVCCEVFSSEERPKWKEFNVQVGDNVKASIDIDAREWINPKTGEVRWLDTIRCWNLEHVNNGQDAGHVLEVNNNQTAVPSGTQQWGAAVQQTLFPPQGTAPVQAPTAGANDGKDLPF